MMSIYAVSIFVMSNVVRIFCDVKICCEHICDVKCCEHICDDKCCEPNL